MDSGIENAITVHIPGAESLKFKRCANGLYFLDIATIKLNTPVVNYTFVSTVAGNQAYFTRQEIEGADKAHLLQGCIG